MRRPVPFDVHEVKLGGTSLVEASAGTGKTYSIAILFLRFILEGRIPLEKILVVTYTKAATAELKERIRFFLRRAVELWDGSPAGEDGSDDDIERIVSRFREGDEGNERYDLLKQAVVCFDEAAIFTIHGFCQRVLGDYAFETGSPYAVEMITDQGDIVRETVEDYYRSFISTAPRPILSYVRSRKLTLDSLLSLVRSTISHQLLKVRYPLDVESGECLDAWNEVKREWERSSGEIKSILATSPDLKRNKENFKETVLGDLFRLLEFCIEGDNVDAGIFSKFTDTHIAGETKNNRPVPEHRFFVLCGDLVRTMEAYTGRLRGDLFHYVRSELPARKEEKGVQFFDDLLARLYEALASGNRGEMLVEAVRTKYSAALIDEFQDTDALQYYIFSRIFEHPKGILFLIGDPKQSIYGFRGADVFSYIDASRRVEDRYTLGKNWRSETPLVRAFNELFSLAAPFLFDEIGYEDVEAAGRADEKPLLIDGERRPPMVIWHYPDEKPLARGAAQPMIIEALTAEILGLLSGSATRNGEPVRPGDMAVLVQKWFEARDVKQALDEAGVPAIMSGVASVFSSGEAADLLLILLAVAEPSRESYIRGALLTDLMGYDPSFIHSFNREELRREEWLDRFREYNRLWEKRGFIYMLSRLFSENNIKDGIISYSDGERRLTNISHLVELLHQQSLHGASGMHDLTAWFAEKIEDTGSRSEEYEQRLESDDNAVKIVTIHRSKGLQYPIVFCPFLWDTADLRDETAFTFHEGTDECLVIGLEDDAARRAAVRESLAEKLRLFYVAVTRAQHRCYLAWGDFKNSEDSAAAYLLNEMERRFAGSTVISIEPAPLRGAFAYSGTGRETECRCRSFQGDIPHRWKISSFSALTAGKTHETAEDRDSFTNREVTGQGDTVEEDKGGYHLPGGTRTGTALHRIFELIDFTAPGMEIIRDVMEEYDLAGENGLAVEYVSSMVDRVLNAGLDGDAAFSLGMIPREDRLTELEFYFPLNRLSPGSLRCIDESITIDEVEGFLHGFIDCVFRFEGRYYIIDWKSNYLGRRGEDYEEEKLAHAMKEHRYDLQYHIYTVALHRYLSITMKGYSYDEHFGGVYYIFLRGVEPGTGRGLYFDRPGKSKIDEITKILAG